MVGALITMVAVRAVALFGLQVRERWQTAWSDARRFLLRSRRPMIEKLRDQQRDLAARLEQLR